jgi:hypothetical protein
VACYTWNMIWCQSVNPQLKCGLAIGLILPALVYSPAHASLGNRSSNKHQIERSKESSTSPRDKNYSPPGIRTPTVSSRRHPQGGRYEPGTRNEVTPDSAGHVVLRCIGDPSLGWENDNEYVLPTLHTELDHNRDGIVDPMEIALGRLELSSAGDVGLRTADLVMERLRQLNRPSRVFLTIPEGPRPLNGKPPAPKLRVAKKKLHRKASLSSLPALS